MKYLKPSLSYTEQAQLLVERGLQADEGQLAELLANVGYYHLSAYLYPFKDKNSDLFLPGTSLEQIYSRYRFDRQFRCLLIDAIERVEVALKTKIVTSFTQKYGPFGYVEQSNFQDFSAEDFQKLQKTIVTETQRHLKSKEHFVVHYFEKYDEEAMPFWMVAELLTFGNILTIYMKLHRPLQAEIASEFGLPIKLMESWLLTLNHVRNICAHHGRLWNRRLGIKPLIPTSKKHPEWQGITNDKPFIIVLMLSYLLNYCAPHSNWRQRVEALLGNFKDLPWACMGFPAQWTEHQIWQKKWGHQ